MAKGISETHGEALLTDGTSVKLYKALRPLVCATCAGSIKEGELFTRSKLQGLQIAPRCERCSPFKLKPLSTGSNSALLKSLFEPSPASKSRSQSATATEQVRVRREVEKRLGPALRRSRSKS